GRRGHPVRPLLGQRCALAGAALRDLLLPGHRVLPGARACPVRARRPGRAQAGPRIPADVRAQPPSHRPPGICRGVARMVRTGGAGGAPLRPDPGRTRPVPDAGMSHGHGPFPLVDDPDAPFPPAALALREPDGLLAVGGDLSPRRLLNAYRGGIFPWYSDGQPILWWSPDPRLVFRTDAVRLSSRFRRSLRRCDWRVRADTDFAAVIAACADSPRLGQSGTWITASMRAAYLRLHQLGHAHSIEVWDRQGRLAGGLYGVAVGRMFFGENMFSAYSGGSKVALA